MREGRSLQDPVAGVARPQTERLAEERLREFGAAVDLLCSELSRVVIGHGDVMREVLLAVFSGGHVLLEGVPGVGKTLMVRSVAEVLGLQFKRVQCTPDLIPADVTGTNILVESEAGAREIRFRHGPIFAMVVLADEINRATPKTQSAFLEAMQENQVTVSGETYALPRPFLVLATQNPIEMEGTFPLPEAQLDRFMYKSLVRFPAADELRRIASETTGAAQPDLRPVLSPQRVMEMRELARCVPVAPELLDAAARIVRGTHPEDERATGGVRRYVRYGASPRAVQALVLGAKVHALMRGRCHVAPADIEIAVAPALRHRVLLNFEASAEAVEVDGLVEEIVTRELA
jgi:MoxR-like ATPase